MPNEPRLLVVDDDELMATTLLDILWAKGYEAEAACSGLGALEKLAQGEFDCIVTDVRMPGYSGLELLQGLRIGRPLVPVVLMTAYSSPDVVAQGLEEGAIAVLTKPIDVELLLRFLSALRPPPSVLLVTRDVVCAQSIETSLRTQGLTVTEDRDAPCLVCKAQAGARVVLLDLDSPETPGVLQLLQEECTDVSFLAAGSSERPGIPEDGARKLAAYAYLQKPIDPEELLQLLRRMHVDQLRSLFR